MSAPISELTSNINTISVINHDCRLPELAVSGSITGKMSNRVIKKSILESDNKNGQIRILSKNHDYITELFFQYLIVNEIFKISMITG